MRHPRNVNMVEPWLGEEPWVGEAQVDASLTMSPGIVMQTAHEETGLLSVVSKPSASASLGN